MKIKHKRHDFKSITIHCVNSKMKYFNKPHKKDYDPIGYDLLWKRFEK